MHTEALDVALENVGPGPDPLRIADLTAAVEPTDPKAGEEDTAHDVVVLSLQRDHHCGNCRRQLRGFAERYDEFRDRGAEVVSIVPEPRDRVAEWQADYELPFPLCADPEATAGTALDQPVRFGPLGQLSDYLGRMPTTLVLSVREPGDLRVVAAYRGRNRWDRPTVEGLLADCERAAGEPTE